MVQEQASHGYVVVTVDRTYDTFSEFPDGRLIVPLDDPKYVLGPADFARDIRFVLDCVEDLAAGRNPDADQQPLPEGLLGALDQNRIGMFGWSKSATATTLVMSQDQRVQAGLSFDGPMQPTITTDPDRPFMLMTAEFPGPGSQASPSSCPACGDGGSTSRRRERLTRRTATSSS